MCCIDQDDSSLTLQQQNANQGNFIPQPKIIQAQHQTPVHNFFTLNHRNEADNQPELIN
jgi:hypothetical protein